MITAFQKQQINANIDDVWALVADFMKVDEIAPEIVKVDALSDGEIGVGSSRRCHFKNGSNVVETISIWEPNQYMKLDVPDLGSMPLKHMDAEIKLVDLGENRTEIYWATNFEPKFGILGKLMGNFMMKGFMAKIILGNIDALKAKLA